MKLKSMFACDSTTLETYTTSTIDFFLNELEQALENKAEYGSNIEEQIIIII